MQGEADGTVDWPYNLEVLKAKFAEPQILMLPEARHHLANELPGIRQRYFDFIDQRLADHFRSLVLWPTARPARTAARAAW